MCKCLHIRRKAIQHLGVLATIELKGTVGSQDRKGRPARAALPKDELLDVVYGLGTAAAAWFE